MARTTAKCMGCGNNFNVVDMVATACNNRGKNKVAYMCKHCATTNERYTSDRHNGEIGGVFDGFKFGIELETNMSSDDFRNMMFRFDFEATHDGSLNDKGERRYVSYGFRREASCEYVSKTNKGMKRFSKQFIEVEKALASGDVVMDDSCGTHCHISYNDMENGEMEMICKYYQSLFLPIQQVMINNPWKTQKFFGRFFHHTYADVIKQDTRMRQGVHGDRFMWVNCTNNSNIEFRINKFVSAEQMRKCCMFEKWVVKTIVDNFTSKYNSTPANQRKALAQKTGEKLAKKMAKEFTKM